MKPFATVHKLAGGAATLMLLAGAGILLASPASARADDIPVVSVRAHTIYHIEPEDFSLSYAGHYRLQNGQTLLLRRRAHHFFARLEGARDVELFPQAPDVFQTSTGATMIFADEGNEVTVRGFERMPGNRPVRRAG